jgi:NAD(P)-dependent dehydrogenase (short-subunit alcohol dehydrogenase family)
MTGSGDRIVVVTGGSRGIGRAICAALSAPGTTVYFNYNSNLDAAIDDGQGHRSRRWQGVLPPGGRGLGKRRIRLPGC